jgi:UDPglucose 6-dehydrogenase
MKVSVFGAGYVGLVTASCLAENGHFVVCVDIDAKKIDAICRGVAPFHEKSLEELLKRNLNVRLSLTTQGRRAVLDTDLSIIAVGTPCHDGAIDLTQIKEVSHAIGKALKDKKTYHVIVVKSTVVPGTTDEIVLPILETMSGKKVGEDFGLGMNPEFLTEGQAVQDFMVPDRIVIGGVDEKSIAALEELYESFPKVPRLKTNNKTAEMIKYASNALLATLISFSNEMGNLCAALGDVDVVDVMTAVHLSQYLSLRSAAGEALMTGVVSFLAAGCGFGGSCLPKDVKALSAHGQKIGMPMQLLDAVLRINEHQPQRVVSLVKKHFPSLEAIRIAILGLAFRPDTSDMRESPAIPIINQLMTEGADIKAYDPAAAGEAGKLFGNSRMKLCFTLSEAIRDVDAIVLVTRWEEFKKVPELLAALQSQPVLIDGRRMLDKRAVAKYEGIGLS